MHSSSKRRQWRASLRRGPSFSPHSFRYIQFIFLLVICSISESEQVHDIDMVIANANSCLLRLDPDKQQPLPSARFYIVLQRNKLSLVPGLTSGLPFPNRATRVATELGSLCRESKSGVVRVQVDRLHEKLIYNSASALTSQ